MKVKKLTWKAKKELGETYVKLIKLATLIAKKATKTENPEELGIEIIEDVYSVLSLDDIEKLVNTFCEGCNIDEMSEVDIVNFVAQVLSQVLQGQKKAK